MAHFHVDAGSARLAGTDWPGAGDATTIVALHAGVADRRAWTECATAWAARGWRVVVYDRRGFGDSEWEAATHDHVDDLVAVLDDRGIGQAVLVGNSMGGALAIDAALAHPDRVRALVLVASAVTGTPPVEYVTTEAEQRLEAAVGAADEAGDLEEVNRLECHYWLDGPDRPEGRVGGEARRRFLDMNGRALAAPPTGTSAARPDAWSRLGDITVPALVVAGALDERIAAVFAARLAADLPDARSIELADSAHLPPLDAPDRFSDVVAEFVERLPSAR